MLCTLEKIFLLHNMAYGQRKIPGSPMFPHVLLEFTCIPDFVFAHSAVKGTGDIRTSAVLRGNMPSQRVDCCEFLNQGTTTGLLLLHLLYLTMWGNNCRWHKLHIHRTGMSYLCDSPYAISVQLV